MKKIIPTLDIPTPQLVCKLLAVLATPTFGSADTDGAELSGELAWALSSPRLKLNNAMTRDAKRAKFAYKVLDGGIFDVASPWFWAMGGSANGLALWGGATSALYFPVWLCGGALFAVKCYRVGTLSRPSVNSPVNYGQRIDRPMPSVDAQWLAAFDASLSTRRNASRTI